MNTNTLVKLKTDLLLKGTTSYNDIIIALSQNGYKVDTSRLIFFVDTFDEVLDTLSTLLSMPSFDKANNTIFFQQGNQISFWKVEYKYSDLLALKEVITNPPNQLGKYYEAGLEKVNEFKKNLKLDPTKPIQIIFHNSHYIVATTRTSVRVEILGKKEVMSIDKADHVFWLLANAPNESPKYYRTKSALYLYLLSQYLHDHPTKVS